MFIATGYILVNERLSMFIATGYILQLTLL
jgi:hypothetical protein